MTHPTPLDHFYRRALCAKAPASTLLPGHYTSTDLHFVDTPLATGVIARGNVLNHDLAAGIRVHMTDTIELETCTIDGIINPRVTLILVLTGRIVASHGPHTYTVDARHAAAGRISFINHATPWQRHMQAGTQVRKVVISFSHAYLAAMLRSPNTSTPPDPAATFLQQHLHGANSTFDWIPSKRAIALAEQILHDHHTPTSIKHLHMQSRALEIFCEFLRSCSHTPQTPDPACTHKAAHLRAYIESHLQHDLTLAGIASTFGMAITSMQRQFKAAFGVTVMDYIRARRLALAKIAMEQDGKTIAQAAHIAKYKSPANFATAFKRAYGVSPSALKET
jgi:AraC-like DNA-binding protein